MPVAAALLLTLLALGGTAASAVAQNAAPEARALLVAWHEDPARIDRARALFESAAVADPSPETLTDLSHTWFLTGEFRAPGEAERVAAYERGVEAARRAIAAAPRLDRAHFYVAINSGRLAELRGLTGAVGLVGTIREESETVLRLNPTNVEGLILAASLAARMPRVLGGDRAKAEVLFRQALELDPHHTGGRLELARLYVATRRWRQAERELQLVLNDPSPTDLPRWTVSERARARTLLIEVYERRGITGAPQSP